ncbi:thioredoxin family protein [Qipengyuania sp. 6D47A]|uniref:Thioredoxin family protein n=1 Tax=Qipengyuania qiaonensis TaxID=2867240 RepID=A0ABS7J8R0_9SPHN|nr:thioredoxin family protein [Qipengyuania qiaonensis]
MLERLAALLVLLAVAFAGPVSAQGLGDDRIPVELVAESAPQPGETWLVALHFTPSSPEWHGYWSNPGDAGLGMQLEWQLPDGWQPGEPLYPLPRRLVIGGLMNHIYEGDYAVLVPISVPEGAAVANIAPIGVTADYLACTDKICVPQQARLTLDPSRVGSNPQFSAWLADAVPQLDSDARFELTRTHLRVGIPIPAETPLGDVHFFLGTPELGGGDTPNYTGAQTFRRQGNLLVAEMPIDQIAVPPGVELTAEPRPGTIEGILDLGEGRGVRLTARPGDVPLEGVEPFRGNAEPVLWQLLLAALAGGLLLNIMPCVFPILSLKALALAKAGGDERTARRDALAYTAGVVVACAALGSTILLLRSAGEQIGWAFQLQEPAVLVSLFLLALAITANFLGLFQVPGMAVAGGAPSRSGSFSTGLLAAFVATPCTGPFMAVALGAALVIEPVSGLLVFMALGVGLALPFLLVGFIPSIRRRLPRPGVWMETFRRWMALPMGLTALALAWLIWRIGGAEYLALVLALGAFALGGLALVGLFQRRTRTGTLVIFAALVAVLGLGTALLPRPEVQAAGEAESLLDPIDYSEAALAEARRSGRPVFVWFTADWCVTCKVNEGVAIEREATRQAFEDANVIAMRGDWTQRDEEISRMLTQQGAAGVPLYLWYAPGGEAEQLPQVLTPDLLVEKARASARPE